MDNNAVAEAVKNLQRLEDANPTDNVITVV